MLIPLADVLVVVVVVVLVGGVGVGLALVEVAEESWSAGSGSISGGSIANRICGSCPGGEMGPGPSSGPWR